MGVVNMVVGTVVIVACGALFWGIGLMWVSAFNTFSGETLGITCLIPLVLVLGYFMGGGIHDYRASLGKAKRQG